MELHKPQGFVNGGLNFQQRAMGNQSKQNDQGIMNIITDPVSGMDKDVNFVDKDVNFQPVELLDEGIAKIHENAKERENNMPGNIIDNRIKEKNYRDDLEQLKLLEEQKAKAEQGMFTTGERKGLFAAQLAMSLARPGDPIVNLAQGLAGGAETLGKTKLAEAELAAKNKKDRGKKLWVWDKTADNNKGKNVRIYEDEYDPAKHTKSLTREKGTMDVVSRDSNGVFNIRTIEKIDFDKNVHSKYLGKIKVLNKATQREEEITLNEYFSDLEAAKRGSFQSNYELPPDMKTKDYEQMLIQKKAEAEMDAQIKRETELKDRLGKIADLNRLGQRAKSFINFGARGGWIADASGMVASATSMAEAFRRQNVETYGDYHLNDPDYLKVKGLIESERKSSDKNMALLQKRFQNLDSGLQSLLIEIAYAKAKTREEGGRFSVTDIELAMRSMGDNANPNILKQKLSTMMMADIYNVIQSWQEGTGQDSLPQGYEYLKDAYNDWSKFAPEDPFSPARKEYKTKKPIIKPKKWKLPTPNQ